MKAQNVVMLMELLIKQYKGQHLKQVMKTQTLHSYVAVAVAFVVVTVAALAATVSVDVTAVAVAVPACLSRNLRARC